MTVDVPGLYADVSREAWRDLAAGTPLPLTDAELTALRGLGEPIGLTETREIYLPLARLVSSLRDANGGVHGAVAAFLGETARPVPFIVGVAGSVAAGKSTVSRLLRTLLARGPGNPAVDLVTTDSFLYSNAELAGRGLADRKGFPESYDRRALVRFVASVKAGAPEAAVPVYSHLAYDIVPGARHVVRRPDILIVEGLNVLQAPAPGRLGIADLFDYSIYVDARIEDIRRWYIDRVFALRRTVFADPRSYFHRYAHIDEDETAAFAHRVWRDVNEVNLVSNILPTRERARLVLAKDRDHAVQRIRLRRV
ncbi:type I pantothenate kinase [Actinomadura flavalba]|uniref:type I pantothenate kinase n=1 Tax=Actinomadura flavalba TaxID=1120938 RepID=UPI00036886AB|nr:type I pantothenate kinase [Actinomadura flavalba]